MWGRVCWKFSSIFMSIEQAGCTIEPGNSHDFHVPEGGRRPDSAQQLTAEQQGAMITKAAGMGYILNWTGDTWLVKIGNTSYPIQPPSIDDIRFVHKLQTAVMSLRSSQAQRERQMDELCATLRRYVIGGSALHCAAPCVQ